MTTTNLIREEVLYVLRCGPSAYRTDPALCPDARGVCNRIKRLSKKIEENPIIGLRLWNRHEAALANLPIVKGWWAYRHYHLTAADDVLFEDC